MPAGRPPKPTALKVLQGNPGHRALNVAEPKPPAEPVSPPSWLRGRSRTLWKRIAAFLEPMGVLTTADTDALALLCDAYAEYIECRDVVRKHGATYESRVIQASTRKVADGAEDATDQTEEDAEFAPGDWSVIIRPRPEVKMASDAWRRVQRMLTEFGMTASSRSKLHIAAKEETADPFAEWERDGRSAG
jgi:P27 family predicted phage terminase small subunit